MRVALGEPVAVELPAIDPPPNYYGARVEVPVTRAVVSYWRRAELGEDGWTVTVESPPARGAYVLAWRSGNPDPAPEVFVPLFVGNPRPSRLGEPVTAAIPSPAGFPDDLTARIEEPVTRTVVVPEQPAVRDFVEDVDDTGELGTSARETAVLPSPAEAGEYLICFRTSDARYEAFVPLFLS